MIDWLKLGRKKGHFARLDSAGLPEFTPGSVWLVGAGPGAPGLLSLLAYHALGQADVIVHDALVSEEVLALARPEAERIPAGKRGGQPSSKQKDITLRIIELAWAGKRVLRLKGGDPYLFGRGGEEALALEKSGIPFRVVPGISAGLGGLAYAGIPATHRDTNHAVLFLTGHDVNGTVPGSVDWAAIAHCAPVLVLFMAVRHLPAIAQKLLDEGRDPDDRVAIVSKATLPAQSVIECPLAEVAATFAGNDIPTPAVVVLGPVSQYRERLDWYAPVLRESGLASNPALPRSQGLVIAAPHSNSGKTLVALGLARALADKGLAIAPAKSGPDYIDPQFLARAARHNCLNLDAWAMGETRLRALAETHAGAGFLLVEGVMGLFDGASSGMGSTADLAVRLSLPVALVIDCAHLAQSVAAIAEGFLRFRNDVRFAGIILNRVASDRHEAMLRDALDARGIVCLGAIRNDPALSVPGRHLGLVQPEEIADIDPLINAAAAVVTAGIDLDALLEHAGPLRKADASRRLPPLGQRIAVAHDKAFGFMYRHWLTDWLKTGVEVSFFSPLADEAPDSAADAVFLPGGYPELYGNRLAAATRFKKGLAAARARDALIYGECGGYMVLGQALTDANGKIHEMTGLLPHESRMDEPRRTLGYRVLRHQGPLPFARSLSGHEFHYSRATGPSVPQLFVASDAAGNRLGPMGAAIGRVCGSYAHVIDTHEATP